MSKARPPTVKTMLYRLLVIQLVIILIVAGWWGIFISRHAGYSACLGGLVLWIPNLWFAARVFVRRKNNQPGRLMWRFYTGELIKLALVGVLFVLVFKFIAIDINAFFWGFFASVIAYLLAPLSLLIPQSTDKSKSK